MQSISYLKSHGKDRREAFLSGYLQRSLDAISGRQNGPVLPICCRKFCHLESSPFGGILKYNRKNTIDFKKTVHQTFCNRTDFLDLTWRKYWGSDWFWLMKIIKTLQNQFEQMLFPAISLPMLRPMSVLINFKVFIVILLNSFKS